VIPASQVGQSGAKYSIVKIVYWEIIAQHFLCAITQLGNLELIDYARN
jgi:hypothetical protein